MVLLVERNHAKANRELSQYGMQKGPDIRFMCVYGYILYIFVHTWMYEWEKKIEHTYAGCFYYYLCVSILWLWLCHCWTIVKNTHTHIYMYNIWSEYNKTISSGRTGCDGHVCLWLFGYVWHICPKIMLKYHHVMAWRNIKHIQDERWVPRHRTPLVCPYIVHACSLLCQHDCSCTQNGKSHRLIITMPFVMYI